MAATTNFPYRRKNGRETTGCAVSTGRLFD